MFSWNNWLGLKMSEAPNFISSFSEKYAAHLVIVSLCNTVSGWRPHADFYEALPCRLINVAFALCEYGPCSDHRRMDFGRPQLPRSAPLFLGVEATLVSRWSEHTYVASGYHSS